MKMLISKKLLLILFLIIGSHINAQTEIVGLWEGKIEFRGMKLGLVIHIKEDGDKLTGKLDSPDQGAFGMEASKVEFNNGELVFHDEERGMKYVGKLNKAKNQVEGKFFQMGNELPLVLIKKVNKIVGSWKGKIEFRGMKLGLVIHIKEDGDKLTGKLDSPDQGAFGMEASKVEFNDGELLFHDGERGMKYVGKFDEAKNLISGTFFQMGNELPLSLVKTEVVSEKPIIKRPQSPKGPFPYQEEEVTVYNKHADINLSATLTLPKDGNNFPAVVLVSGSGPQDRNSEIMGHKPFLVIADYLTRNGIAVIRYDERGVKKSEGDFRAATTYDFSTDTESMVDFLKNHPKINSSKIGVIGHSEGGIIAPMLAARRSDLGFIIMLAGAGEGVKETLLYQDRLIEKANGLSDDIIEENQKQMKKIFDFVQKMDSNDKRDIEKLKEMFVKKLSVGGGDMDHEKQASRMVRRMSSAWFKYLLNYDPVDNLKKVKCPVLAVNGMLDLQVDYKSHLPIIEKAFKEGLTKDYEIVKFPKLNHLMQTAKTGSPAEYGVIQETFAPVVLEKMKDWILEKTSE